MPKLTRYKTFCMTAAETMIRLDDVERIEI